MTLNYLLNELTLFLEVSYMVGMLHIREVLPMIGKIGSPQLFEVPIMRF
jgi:hypothetical protein